jgi:hypothetical protein
MDDVTIGRTEANGQHTDKHELANMLKGRSDMVEVIECANFSRQDKMLMRRARAHRTAMEAMRLDLTIWAIERAEKADDIADVE